MLTIQKHGPLLTVTANSVKIALGKSKKKLQIQKFPVVPAQREDFDRYYLSRCYHTIFVTDTGAVSELRALSNSIKSNEIIATVSIDENETKVYTCLSSII